MARRIAIVAGLIGGAAWIAKMFIMWSAGGPDLDSTPEAIAFFLGFIGIPVAGAAAGWTLAAGAVRWKQVAALVAGFLAPLLIMGAVQAVLGALLPDAGWFRDEAILGLLGLAAVVLAVLATMRGRAGAASSPPSAAGSLGA